MNFHRCSPKLFYETPISCPIGAPQIVTGRKWHGLQVDRPVRNNGDNSTGRLRRRNSADHRPDHRPSVTFAVNQASSYCATRFHLWPVQVENVRKSAREIRPVPWLTRSLCCCCGKLFCCETVACKSSDSLSAISPGPQTNSRPPQLEAPNSKETSSCITWPCRAHAPTPRPDLCAQVSIFRATTCALVAGAGTRTPVSCRGARSRGVIVTAEQFVQSIREREPTPRRRKVVVIYWNSLILNTGEI